MISLLTPARRMFFSISRAWPSSSSIMMIVTGVASALMRRSSRCLQVSRQNDAKCRSLVESGGHRDGAAEIAHHRAHMGETDAFACLVLRAGTPEQFKDALAVMIGNSPSIVGDLDADTV